MIKGFYCEEKRKNVTFAECLACAATHENTCEFDYPILASMQGRIRRGRGISVSSLLSCLRKVVLEARTDVYLKPKNLYYAFRGQLFHSVIAEAHNEAAICEKRFERTVAGIILSGHPDVIYPEKRKLVDYKSTRRIPKDSVPYANHGIQVNLYRYLAGPQYKIDHLEIIYFDMSKVKKVKVELISQEELVHWLTPRLTVLKKGLDGGKLPEKVDKEGIWQCDGFCPFTRICWPKGVPKSWKGKKKGKTKSPPTPRTQEKKLR